ncbi:MAG: ABC transporter ATP-binding protein [Woeseiaceae bacterium]
MIRVKKLCKAFQRPGEGVLHVLRDVDFEVDPGEFVAIVGASGSGKTTLMNILGLLDRPDSGEYELQGRAVSNLSAEQRARVRNETIGFVFQQFHLLARTTATENVELPLLYSTATENDISRKAREALCRVGLEERLAHYPNELSGGQQQRVAIARALVNDPGVILADEPTGNLDRDSGARIMNLFRELNRNGSTILLITHDEAVASSASRIVRIADGQVVNVMAREAS